MPYAIIGIERGYAVPLVLLDSLWTRSRRLLKKMSEKYLP